ncbi:MAG: hypothetical protein H6Q64_620, partial [Firmicutes bacterium]|nr:hypothetical protein [Bacillota bacterium]
TVSIGIAQRMRAESFTHWYRRTDRALYHAKQNGRNQFVCSDSKEILPLDSVYIAWRKEWECGNKEIDRQHLEIVELGNRLFSLVSEVTQQAELITQLDILLEHIVQHFDYEEKVMLEIGYPEQMNHTNIHKNLAEKALWLKQAFINGGLESSAFISFLTDDVVHGHMEIVDTKFFPYIRT